MKKYIDGVNNDGMLEQWKISFLPVIKSLSDVIGFDVMTQYSKEFFGNDSHLYDGCLDIGLGESKGWADTEQQIEFLQYILSRLEVEKFYNYKSWVGLFNHVICK